MNYVNVRECSVRISKLLEEIDLLERMISDNHGNLSDIEVNQIENEIIHKYKELHKLKIKLENLGKKIFNIKELHNIEK